ncbi:hypothetical protein GOP47_0006411 [Adiantum capillus-veneris]|uniref:Glyoxal oxidase N-terminal domain-containing protein n=1 Tax=Adiantum capillus-veneris TaxID=13818 RepID=A0A9D4V3D5_ADICA|nr:hypothetical protein GOP47_0006411 [Adiantum capillus-veneris]
MHTAVTHHGNVLFLDRTNIGPSAINLTNSRCRDNPKDVNQTHDCTAHSVLFTPGPNTVRPLFIFTPLASSLRMARSFRPAATVTAIPRFAVSHLAPVVTSHLATGLRTRMFRSRTAVGMRLTRFYRTADTLSSAA